MTTTDARRRTGAAGVTHCGSWMAVEPGPVYDWRGRLVCVREPGHRGRHRTTDGWAW
jgi:hypothetical protein